MYSKYNIPQYRQNMQSYNTQSYPYYRNSSNDGDRLFLGGGFVAPFLLGGIAGSLLTRPNYPIYAPGPIYYPPRPYPYYNNYYYYYY